MKIFTSLIFGLFLLLPTFAGALELNEARSKKLVTEQPDGYIKALDASAKDLEAKVNQERKKAYEDIAKQHGGKMTLQQVGEQAAKKIKEKLGN